jgi:hypothetical protein
MHYMRTHASIAPGKDRLDNDFCTCFTGNTWRRRGGSLCGVGQLPVCNADFADDPPDFCEPLRPLPFTNALRRVPARMLTNADVLKPQITQMIADGIGRQISIPESL